MSYLFWLQVVLIRTQPEKTCPTKNVVFIGVSGFVVLMQSYHPAKPVRFVCIEPWHSLPGAQTDTQEWSQRAAAACLAPGQTWETTLSTTFER